MERIRKGEAISHTVSTVHQGQLQSAAAGGKVSVFRRLWNWWKPIARKIGDFQARVILSIFYFVIFMPFALLVRLAMDPLRMKSKDDPQWHEKEKRNSSPSHQW